MTYKLWPLAGQGGEKQDYEKKTKNEQINVCSKITMHHKPINLARRDGRELGMVEIPKEGHRGNCKMLMVNDRTETLCEYKIEMLRSGSRERIRRQR